MKPVLLLVPGMLNDHRVWADVVLALQGQADVRVADVLSQSSVPQMARDAWRQLHDVPAGAPVVLAGFSLGGYVALEMLAHPAREIQALTLVSTSGRPESPEAAATREKTIAAMQADFPKVVEGILKWSTHELALKGASRLREMMLDIGADRAIAQARAVMARGDHGAMLRHLDLPVRILCGRNDRVTPLALSEELSGWIPGAQLQIIEQCGHMLPCEQPDAVVKALRELLACMNS